MSPFMLFTDRTINKLFCFLMKRRVIAKEFWKLSGCIAERFAEKDSGEYDDLRYKIYYWITSYWGYKLYE